MILHTSKSQVVIAMGRTLETYRVLLESEQSFWFKKVKRTSYEPLTKELFNSAQHYADAITFWSSGQIREKMLFSMLFSQYKTLIEAENSD